jgi:hypothetical protein
MNNQQSFDVATLQATYHLRMFRLVLQALERTLKS